MNSVLEKGAVDFAYDISSGVAKQLMWSWKKLKDHFILLRLTGHLTQWQLHNKMQSIAKEMVRFENES